MTIVAFYDTKPYDRLHVTATPAADTIDWTFHEFRLSEESAVTAQGADAVCVFVNDRLDKGCRGASPRGRAAYCPALCRV